LTVNEEETLSPSKGASDFGRKQLSLAGTIKNFMVADRTMVVESISSSPSVQAAVGAVYAMGPLDEGSLLVIEVPLSLTGAANLENNESGTRFIPLGRIFEVFGPVSQPLYTVRLPSPLPSPGLQPHSTVQAIRNDKNTTTDEQTLGEGSVSNENEQKSTEASLDEEQNGKEGASSPASADRKTNDKVNTDESSANSPKKIATVDRWAADGAYTKFVSENKGIQVFYVQDEAKLIDTGSVIRSSGKGCDASNIYDEEVINSSEMYYSDDEQEREAKNKKKGGARRNQNKIRNRQQNQHGHKQRDGTSSRRFHGSRTALLGFQMSSPPLHQQPSYPVPVPNLPQGFHRMPPPPPPPPPTLGAHSNPSHFQAQQLLPPPPPPPYGVHYHHPYQTSAPRYPPPPKNPDEPPAYQY